MCLMWLPYGVINYNNILGVHPPVELLQAGPVILYNLLANPSRDGARFLDAAGSHKLITFCVNRRRRKMYIVVTRVCE